MAVRHGLCLLTEKKVQAFEIKCLKKLLRISYLEHMTNDWVRREINFHTMWDVRNLFYRLSRDGNLHVFGRSCDKSAFPKPSFGEP